MGDRTKLRAFELADDAMREAGLLDEINSLAPAVWQQKWVVDVQPAGDVRAALKYLAPCVYRVAISNNRRPIYGQCRAVDESSVTYRFTPMKNREPNALLG